MKLSVLGKEKNIWKIRSTYISIFIIFIILFVLSCRYQDKKLNDVRMKAEQNLLGQRVVPPIGGFQKQIGPTLPISTR